MGRFDSKAFVDYILEATGNNKLSYIGHSQGSTQMFACLGDPNTAGYMNQRLEIFIALAPVVYLVTITSYLRITWKSRL